MSNGLSNTGTIACRQARKTFPALIEQSADSRVVPIRRKLTVTERAAAERHLQTCGRCAGEYRLLTLSHAAMDAAAAPEAVTPDEDFFKALRAAIARGEKGAWHQRTDESWTAALALTARQLIPAMAMLLLLIIGATMLWSNTPNVAPKTTITSQIPRRERIVLNDIYDVPPPTADDVLETLVAVEEKENGK
ncbi:MAG TPA: hypothetical protein VJZ26_03215 [Blastocatellia bacterium]|nr:hypothetical protein [Blastocatellia bacterium]